MSLPHLLKTPATASRQGHNGDAANHLVAEPTREDERLNLAGEEIARLQLQLDEARALLDAMRGSTGFRLTQGFWVLRDRLLQPGSRARAVYDQGVSRVKGRFIPAPPAVDRSPEGLPAPTVQAALAPAAEEPAISGPSTHQKEALAGLYRAELQTFLSSGQRLDLTPRGEPVVSVLLILFNRAELTLKCLRSLAEQRHPSLEVVIVDNASSDATGELLSCIDGAKVIRSAENLHFLRGVNLAARSATAKHLLLLNNDAQVLPGAIQAALQTLEGSPDIGAVGGRILLMDGTLQEAGSIIWQDGSCLGYGRGQPACAGPFMFQRDVDYCSGAFLLTPRAQFEALGGLDEAYAPAYYEETDYCVRLWKAGKRVVFEPRAAVVHFEFASSKSSDAAIQMQQERREIFVRRHGDWLAGKQLPSLQNVLAARSQPPARSRVLFLDDRIPHERLGSGSPRAAAIFRSLAGAGHALTFFPTSFVGDAWSATYEDLPRTAEIIVDGGGERLAPFLRERLTHVDRILVSRPHNMVRLRAALEAIGQWPSPTPIVYDAEAIFALRENEHRRLQGQPLSEEAQQEAVRTELALAQGTAAVVAVSQAERLRFEQAGHARTFVLGHALPATPTRTGFASRDGLLFAGALNQADTPNSDSLVWFLSEIHPRLEARLGHPVVVRIAGRNPPFAITRLANDRVRFLGEVPDLTPLYEQARVFIAPTRFAAGLPYKVHHAAAHGVPMVCTGLLAEQVRWQDGRDLLVADDPQAFAEACARLYTEEALWSGVRQQALARVQEDCDMEHLAGVLEQALR